MDKILIVEDSMLNVGMLQSALEDRYKIFVAKNGKVALNILNKKKPDVILLDVTMPIMDGYETYEHIVANEALKGIPVIFLTAMECLDPNIETIDPSRFVRVLKKPFDMQLVEGMIQMAIASVDYER